MHVLTIPSLDRDVFFTTIAFLYIQKVYFDLNILIISNLTAQFHSIEPNIVSGMVAKMDILVHIAFVWGGLYLDIF